MNKENDALLRSFADVTTGGESTIALEHDALVKDMKDTEVILSNCGLGTKEITYEVLRDVGSIKKIVVGHNWNQFSKIDLASLGIELIEGSNVNTISVAEWVMTASLMGIRRLHDFSRRMKSGSPWCEPGRREYSGMLLGKKIGLIGFGRIGRYVCRLFHAFGAKVLIHDDYVTDEVLAPYPVERCPLDTLLSECDIVSIHLAIAPATMNFMDAAKFAKLKDGAIFLNCARSAVCNEKDLLAALKQNRFSAFIDVFDTEPLPMDSEFRILENVNITPHMGGNSIDMYVGCAREAIETIRDYGEGKPVINKKYTI
jgi:phosphoglycerate dehydrogenase-like enzyme